VIVSMKQTGTNINIVAKLSKG